MYPSATSVGGVYFLGTVALRAGLSQRVMYMVSAVKICAGGSHTIRPHSFCLRTNSRSMTPSEGAKIARVLLGLAERTRTLTLIL